MRVSKREEEKEGTEDKIKEKKRERKMGKRNCLPQW